ncbi:MAG: hypothetical protein R3300_20260, partial [Candidatus Promineifilaceae bacterium]|nr:hypothetical protein [Candidatus Promineifilaceae bacterium]
MSNRRAVAWGVIGIVIMLIMTLGLPTGHLLQITAFVLIFIWPTITWSTWMSGSLIERLLMAAGFGAFGNVLLTLVVVYLPIPITAWLLGGIYAAVALAPLVTCQGRLRPSGDRITQDVNGRWMKV